MFHHFLLSTNPAHSIELPQELFYSLRMPVKVNGVSSPSREPFAAVTNMPPPIAASDSDEEDLFDALGIDFGIYQLPVCVNLPGQVDTGSDSSSETFREMIMTWCEGVVDSNLNSPPPELAEFSFSPITKYDDVTTDARGDPMIDIILNYHTDRVLDVCDRSPRTPEFLSLETVQTIQTIVDSGRNNPEMTAHRSSNFIHLPIVVIRLFDAVGNRCLLSNTDGFMYYDPGAINLNNIIQRRGVAVPYNDPILRDPSCFANHAVSVFVEVPILPGMGMGVVTPQLEYIGDYYFHKTQRSLQKEEWMSVSEDIKQALVERYCDTHAHPSDDPNPGARYTIKNVRKWYDLGNVIPLVILQHVQRRPVCVVEPPVHDQFSDCERISFLQIDSDSESEYSQTSATRSEPVYPDVIADFRLPCSNIRAPGSQAKFFESVVSSLTVAETADVQPTGKIPESCEERMGSPSY